MLLMKPTNLCDYDLSQMMKYLRFHLVAGILVVALIGTSESGIGIPMGGCLNCRKKYMCTDVLSNNLLL